MNSPFSRVALSFARALANQDFVAAHQHLSQQLRAQMSPEDLRHQFEEMISYASDIPQQAPLEVEIQTTLDEFHDKRPTDLGWAYASICGEGFSEAVAVVVESVNNSVGIRSIEWGRP
eukprot:TRINITY_DN2931_c0_g1_i2.p1 TRINITY_DN2931_c0_g1~~TRINITY_DN2931_c0_g1_i2.p1  ORF type:complete len:135 (+),score=38.33 TRINITY_DN2931_c0_g1_i2:53-406(+)